MKTFCNNFVSSQVVQELRYRDNKEWIKYSSGDCNTQTFNSTRQGVVRQKWKDKGKEIKMI